jgi:hypothetical protein
MALCIASGGTLTKLLVSAFTLTWVHSVEKIAWEEDLQIDDGQLVVVEARIKGSGAGMEPPPGAVLEDGVWHYRPELPPLPELELANSGAVPDWRLCIKGECRPIGSYLPTAGDVFVLTGCAD